MIIYIHIHIIIHTHTYDNMIHGIQTANLTVLDHYSHACTLKTYTHINIHENTCIHMIQGIQTANLTYTHTPTLNSYTHTHILMHIHTHIHTYSCIYIHTQVIQGTGTANLTVMDHYYRSNMLITWAVRSNGQIINVSSKY